MARRLCRARDGRMVGGVCAGLANYLDIDPTLVRLGWVLMTVIYGMGILGYIVCWIIMPEE